MKQLYKIVITLLIFITCLFKNPNNIAADDIKTTNVNDINISDITTNVNDINISDITTNINTNETITDINTTTIFQNINITAITQETLLDCTKTLKNKSTGEQVKILQKELNKVMPTCNLTVDGIFGSATSTCVINFQKANSLTADAIVGPKTCQKLNDEYQKITSSINKPITPSDEIDLICSKDNNLREGSSKTTQVKFLQEKLNKVMNCNLKTDGSFGPATKSCVIKFQERAKISQDGVVGTTTCNKLKLAYNTKVSGNLTISKQDNENTLDVRSNLSYEKKDTQDKNQVKRLQTELNKIMSCGLTVDGSFGPATKNCVLKFQDKYNLTTDGKVGASTASKVNVEYLKNNTYVISNKFTSIRENTTTDSKEIAIATDGTVFRVYDTINTNNITWYKIKYNKTYAYINSDDTRSNAVVLDISDQILKLYKNKKLVLEAPVITGKENHDTPIGRYLLTDNNIRKSTAKNPISLKGYNSYGEYYDKPVDYWIEFIPSRAIGFHDAPWRDGGQFYNKDIYKTSGSLACVNMRLDNVRTLYDNIKGNDIYVYVND